MQSNTQPLVIFFILVVVCGLWVTACDDKKPGDTGALSGATGFTFLELGADTIYSKSIREKLKGALGSDAVDTRTPIDLEINYPGFLEAYFEPVHKFNLLLNDARGARVEHDTIKLMYRYPQRKNRLFKSVQLLFSAQSGKPLFFYIVSRKEGSGILETMREKYGEPKEIKWSHQPGQSFFWQDKMDFLIVSRILDRFGDPEYRIAIYYGANIDELIRFEQNLIEQSENKRKRAGQTAF